MSHFSPPVNREPGNQVDAEKVLVNRLLADISAQISFTDYIVGQGRDKYFSVDNDGLVLRRAAQKAIEIVAEATKKLPETFKEQHTEVPWREIVNMRNRMTHAYNEIDDDLVWQVLVTRLPELGRQLNLDTVNA